MKGTEQEKPLPHVNSDNRFFWGFCKRHELCFQKCLCCGHVRWPVSILCPLCYSRETKWLRSEGKGIVYTYAIYHHAFHPAFEKDIPYVTAIIAMKEGPHFLSNVVACRPDEVYCGMRVEVVWKEGGGGLPLPVFRPR